MKKVDTQGSIIAWYREGPKAESGSRVWWLQVSWPMKGHWQGIGGRMPASLLHQLRPCSLI